MSTDEAFVNEEGVRNAMQALRRQIQRLEEELEELRDENARLQAEIERESRRNDELDARTNLIDLVEASDDADGRQRSVALLQHCSNKLDADEDTQRVVLDHDDADDALHYPDVERTTIYRDMDRAARFVGDEDVAHYDDGDLTIDVRDADGVLEAAIAEHATEGSR
jgi:hypothetical protein